MRLYSSVTVGLTTVSRYCRQPGLVQAKGCPQWHDGHQLVQPRLPWVKWLRGTWFFSKHSVTKLVGPFIMQICYMCLISLMYGSWFCLYHNKKGLMTLTSLLSPKDKEKYCISLSNQFQVSHWIINGNVPNTFLHDFYILTDRDPDPTTSINIFC